MNKEYFFGEVTLLITHYNRSQSLEQLLLSFEALNCRFGDVVASDDGSKPEHIDYLLQLQKKHDFRLITTPENRGLGNNINKGQDAVHTPLTLYVQEDFTPAAIFPEIFTHGRKESKGTLGLGVSRHAKALVLENDVLAPAVVPVRFATVETAQQALLLE